MLFTFLKKQKEKFAFYNTITGMNKILRRYFVMNSFDGALTTFGLLLGSYFAGVQDSNLIIHIGIATAIAIGFSGLTGALMTESAERTREVHSMERALHRKLDHTDYKKAYDFATVMAALVDGLSPLLTSLILLSPFIFFDITDAYSISFGLSLMFFLSLGAFLGKISKENMLWTSIKLLFAGILCMIVISLVEGF
ncbi:VIT1/CCC1 transporter family protein [Candidatus Micrarchaeota archaeon]|nr:VIT1/CCC1 transporter family protein [Candidatus Micrarchaeota archaeon]MBU1166724.1 VIT1/CCC1 transporter family protein [Candidatus Micrarchaeota archaeon]MBU1886687.1 VIT1/CCC1 transporter family protein [Candidatus Micrarchaeota archaeon]